MATWCGLCTFANSTVWTFLAVVFEGAVLETATWAGSALMPMLKHHFFLPSCPFPIWFLPGLPGVRGFLEMGC